MVQAIFDNHPLGEYLRDAGEIGEVMPGISSELAAEIDPFVFSDLIDEDESPEWRPRMLIQFFDIVHSILDIVQPTKSPNPFVERFKYDIISSSLLASTLQSPHQRPARSPPIPGKLCHSRTTSMESNFLPPSPVVAPSPQEPNYTTPSVMATAAAIFYLTGHTFLAFVSLASVAVSLHSAYVMHDLSKFDMTPCLTSLNELIVASDAWGSAVQEAIANVQVEEESLLYGATFQTASPTSSIRVALHSSLLTTQTQCDNVRQLFSALTCPKELSQLSEMYSPALLKEAKTLSDGSPRPLSLSVSKKKSSSSSPNFNKRSTWNGSYTSLADQVGPLPQVVRRRGRRRSDLTSVLQGTTAMHAQSAPVTPFTSPNTSISVEVPNLPKVIPGAEELELSTDARVDDNSESFGATALAFNRSRKIDAAEIFGPSSPVSQRRQTPSWTPFTVSAGSRLSPLQSSRHPLSVPALQTALNNSLASKRYACSHLLALRFSEDEDEGYWEDIRSVMALLTTTLSDASSRLMYAIEDHEACKLRHQPLSPLSEAESLHDNRRRSPANGPFAPRIRKSVDLSHLTSFAPAPGPYARFAAHMTAISSALEDAKENMENCIQALKEDDPSVSPHITTTETTDARESHNEHPALQAYERLRRELGLALRDCERGRERLLEIVKPSTDLAPHDSDSEDIPGLAHDASDDSDKPWPGSLSDGEECSMVMNRADLSAFLDSKINDDGELARDDVTEHLLLSASPQNLPPPVGIEQVFEADAAAAAWLTRERPKLTREERIKLAKERRESVASARHRDSASSARESDSQIEGGEKWGPGGEVVQELKDVIWKVSERRRKFADSLRNQPELKTIQVPAVDAQKPAADDDSTPPIKAYKS
ncbi:hypothetical protein JOM56_007794 [Amanita muscaria]